MPIAEPRSPHTVNRDLKITKRILRYLIDLEVCTRITHDDLRRALKPITAPVDRKEFLRPDEIRALLEAALEHDAATFAATRAELEGRRQRGTTYRHDPIAPFVLFLLLSGMRRGEALGLQWKDVSLDAVDDLGKPVGEIYIGKQSKTHQARTVSLDVAPSIRRLLSAMRLQSGGGMGAVFGITKGEAIAAMQRLRRPVPKQKNDPHGYGAPPKFTYQVLRVTASTFQTNAGAFGGSAAHISASRCGHSIETAQKHYAGLLRGVPRDLTTLEAMMGIEDLADAIVDSVATGVRALPRELRAG